MKICEITPGLIEIPPKNWGAIEKLIWNYKLSFEKLNHTVDIEYLNNYDTNKYDIMHIHVANLANIAFERGYDYIFSLHDHHILIRDNVLEENLTAIQNSLFTFVFSERIYNSKQLSVVKDKLILISHGVDIEKYKKVHNQNNTKSLLCVGNTGLAGDPYNDRKGFLFAIELSKQLDLPLTICGPNQLKDFLSHYNINENDKLKFKFNLSEDELIQEYSKHKIFLHPSNLEAGDPNLTLIEALSCGLPIVGTCETNSFKMDGMEIVNELSIELYKNAINKVFENYDYYCNMTNNSREFFNWDNIIRYKEYIILDALNIRNRKRFTETLNSGYKNIIHINDNVRIIQNKLNISYLDGVLFNSFGKTEENYDVTFIDNDTGHVVWRDNVSTNKWTAPNLKYFVNWKVIVNGLEFNQNLKNENVLITFESSALGDTIAWIPFLEEFRKKHNCNLTATTFHNEYFENAYPNIKFIKPGVVLDSYKFWYKIGCFDKDYNRNKNNWRTVPLQKVATDILGLEYNEIKPLFDKKILINKNEIGKYVAIAPSSTLQAKHWNYDGGWQTIVNYLNEKGYKVMVVSKEESNLENVIKADNPSLKETFNNINNAEFFIGLGSGLSWVSWMLNKKTILISGFSNPISEFETPYRIKNNTGCTGCYNNLDFEFERGKWNWCPTNKNFECTKLITPNQIIETIENLS